MTFSLTIPQFSQYSVTIQKYTNITNVAKVKEELLTANPDYNYAFINPLTIISLEQLSSAIYRALLDHSTGNARTKGIHSEIVFDLGRGNKIGENLIRFGIADDSKELIIVKVDQEGEISKRQLSLKDVLQGDEVEVTEEEIGRSCDLKILKQNYNIESDSNDVDYLTRLIVNAIQLRGL